MIEGSLKKKIIGLCPERAPASVDAAASVAADRIAGNRRSEPTHDGAVRSRYGSPPVWAEVASGSSARAHAQRIGREAIEGERVGGGGRRHAVREGEPQRRSGSGQTVASASQAEELRGFCSDRAAGVSSAGSEGVATAPCAGAGEELAAAPDYATHRMAAIASALAQGGGGSAALQQELQHALAWQATRGQYPPPPAIFGHASGLAQAQLTQAQLAYPDGGVAGGLLYAGSGASLGVPPPTVSQLASPVVYGFAPPAPVVYGVLAMQPAAALFLAPDVAGHSLSAMQRPPAHGLAGAPYPEPYPGLAEHSPLPQMVPDTPSLEALLSSPRWAGLVEAEFHSRGERDYFEQMDRQSGHIASVIPRARAAGLTHLLHIDDDELVYCAAGLPPLFRLLSAAGVERPNVHMQNVEALLPAPDCDNPFAAVRSFRHFPTQYCSYTNGKSFGVLAAAGLRSHGPHHFRSAATCGGGGAGSLDLPAGVAVVLHYESATYAKWRTKYLELARRHGDAPEVLSRVPFAFYRQSLSSARKLLHAEAEVRLRTPAAAERMRAAEEGAVRLWSKWKGITRLSPGGVTASPGRAAPDG
ncbi:hypothetical protein EMIHUDRAFT_243012 [Emiliania huxleyi CCMP1516]|uniref:Glycosyltransferase family 92 protein n=2 Tax=Emiliania huxleyi TaxID=2903 RepID=A0A0D3J6Z9_EMIH1|nr:hypothetical protein EMIHUDRAFT_243012 [Emiliania huxleyi CCMP1516]EOD19284.1 hypothetical protein EMIHUDRAFT_243012 [Emiliania huxleyi CCMP1516]|eukprot:XP_005771713.1 hypothetical protein EMIHUDRAFT_243012 [Emiliania huxleyi CCMP1516]